MAESYGDMQKRKSAKAEAERAARAKAQGESPDWLYEYSQQNPNFGFTSPKTAPVKMPEEMTRIKTVGMPSQAAIERVRMEIEDSPIQPRQWSHTDRHVRSPGRGVPYTASYESGVPEDQYFMPESSDSPSVEHSDPSPRIVRIPRGQSLAETAGHRARHLAPIRPVNELGQLLMERKMGMGAGEAVQGPYQKFQAILDDEDQSPEQQADGDSATREMRNGAYNIGRFIARKIKGED